MGLVKDRLLRPDQVADELNISKRTAQRLIKAGHFEALKVGGSLRVTESSLRKYIRRQINQFVIAEGVPIAPNDDSRI